MGRQAALLVLLLGIGVAALPVRAQDSPAGQIDVFLAQNPPMGAARVYFLDPLSGLSTVANVESGQGFTLVGDYVLYEKARTGAIMRANADGTLEPHPFIRRAVDTQSLRWVVSPDGQAVAWVQVNQAGVSQAFVAWADGRDLRQLPISTPGAALELLPLALTDGMGQFFYDAAHPIEPSHDVPYIRYEYVAWYSLLDETFYPLMLEPNCPCGAAATADGRIFARLEAERGDGPFAVHIWDLPTGADIRIPAADLPFRVAGDLILNQKGTFAAYSAAAGVGVEAGLLPEQYALVLVDVVAGQQSLAVAPGLARYRPLAFIDGDSALLLAGVSEPGTFKLDLSGGDIRRVSNEIYLGSITTSR